MWCILNSLARQELAGLMNQINMVNHRGGRKPRTDYWAAYPPGILEGCLNEILTNQPKSVRKFLHFTSKVASSRPFQVIIKQCNTHVESLPTARPIQEATIRSTFDCVALTTHEPKIKHDANVLECSDFRNDRHIILYCRRLRGLAKLILLNFYQEYKLSHVADITRNF